MKKIFIMGLAVGMFVSLGAMEKEDDSKIQPSVKFDISEEDDDLDWQQLDDVPEIRPRFEIFNENPALKKFLDLVDNYLGSLKQIKAYHIRKIHEVSDVVLGVAESLDVSPKKIGEQSTSQTKQIKLLNQLVWVNNLIEEKIGFTRSEGAIDRKDIEHLKELAEQAEKIESELLAEHQKHPELLRRVIADTPGSSFEKAIQDKRDLQARLLAVARDVAEDDQYRSQDHKGKQPASAVAQTTSSSSWNGKQTSYADDDWRHTTAYNAPIYKSELYGQMMRQQVQLGVTTELQGDYQTQVQILKQTLDDKQNKFLMQQKMLDEKGQAMMPPSDEQYIELQKHIGGLEQERNSILEQWVSFHNQPLVSSSDNQAEITGEYEGLSNAFYQINDTIRGNVQELYASKEAELFRFLTDEQPAGSDGLMLQQGLFDLENQEQEAMAFENHVQAIHGLRISVLNEQKELKKNSEERKRWQEQVQSEQPVFFPPLEIPDQLTGGPEEQLQQGIQVAAKFLAWSQNNCNIGSAILDQVVSNPSEFRGGSQAFQPTMLEPARESILQVENRNKVLARLLEMNKNISTSEIYINKR